MPSVFRWGWVDLRSSSWMWNVSGLFTSIRQNSRFSWKFHIFIWGENLGNGSSFPLFQQGRLYKFQINSLCRWKIQMSEKKNSASPNTRGSQRGVVYLGWPISPSYMSPNVGGWFAGCQPMSTAVHATWSPNKLGKSNSIFNLCPTHLQTCLLRFFTAIDSISLISISYLENSKQNH
jgi:hypothetical protein